MTKFKAGDKFIPRKPNENKFPIWSKDMDEFNGKVLTVYNINDKGYILAKDCKFMFHPHWCEKVESDHIVDSNKMIEHVPDIGKTIDWEQRKYELVKEFMAAQISGLTSAQVGWSFEDAIKDSIMFADEMIKQLKGES